VNTLINHDGHDGHDLKPILMSCRWCRRGFQVCIVALVVMAATTASAQTREFGLRGFGDVGATTFTAEQSFAAVLGSASGKVFGGGVEVVLPFRLFANVRASRFHETGQRVFLVEGEQFDLGIPTTITVTPVEVTGGYRFGFFDRFTPYGGAGVGWYGFKETSQFATDGENVDERFTGFHILGGAEIGLWRWLALAGELQWATVPDAIGDDPNSVSHEFNESNLGGTTFRFKIVVGM
jgi:opacity protein-like surface antigen